MGQEERKASAAGIETGVDMEQTVASVGLAPGALWVHDRAIDLYVANVEEFIIFQAVFSACLVVGLDIVQLTKTAGQFDVGLIVQFAFSNDNHAVLR